MSLYERGLEKFARTAVGDWYMKRDRAADRPAAAAAHRRAGQQRVPGAGHAADDDGRQDWSVANASAAVCRRRSTGSLLIASNYGKTSHPAWYRNSTANPRSRCSPGKHSGTVHGDRDHRPRRARAGVGAGPRHVRRLRRLRGPGGRPDDPAGPAGARKRLNCEGAVGVYPGHESPTGRRVAAGAEESIALSASGCGDQGFSHRAGRIARRRRTGDPGRLGASMAGAARRRRHVAARSPRRPQPSRRVHRQDQRARRDASPHR